MVSLVLGISRNPRQVDSRFILIFVDVLTVWSVTDAGGECCVEEDLCAIEQRVAATTGSRMLIILLTGDRHEKRLFRGKYFPHRAHLNRVFLAPLRFRNDLSRSLCLA